MFLEAVFLGINRSAITILFNFAYCHDINLYDIFM